jgi:hypothetical protein
LVDTLGPESGAYINIKVELEDGIAKGWLEKKFLVKQEQEGESTSETPPPPPKASAPAQPESSLFEDAPPKPIVPKKKRVPLDERILFQREPTFYYGLSISPNMSFTYTPTYAALFSGIGGSVGADIGFYISKEFVLRTSLEYVLLLGSTSIALAPLSIGFFEVSILPTYLYKNFEFYLGPDYSFGLGIQNMAPQIAVQSPSSLSHLGIIAGAGYRVQLGTNSNFVIRAQYGISLVFDPFFYQVAKILFAFEIWG